jgi:hypothetical protein
VSTAVREILAGAGCGIAAPTPDADVEDGEEISDRSNFRSRAD